VRHVRKVAESRRGSEYTERQGLPELRELLSEDLDNTGAVSAPDVLITAGCNQAFCLATLAVADPGDEMIVPSPHYFNHSMWLEMQGIVPAYLDTKRNGFAPTVPALTKLINDRTRAVVVVSPGNPTGKISGPRDLFAIAELCHEADIALILDETYRAFVSPADRHELYRIPWWRDTLIGLYSFSKEFAIPGYRIGAAVAGERVHREMAKLLDCVAVCAPHIGQEAAIAGLKFAKNWRAERAEDVETRGRYFARLMGDRPGGFTVECTGGFFAWVRQRSTQQSLVTVGTLLKEHGVAVLPGDLFYGGRERYFRFTFASLSRGQADELVARLYDAGASRNDAQGDT
jgi:aspartate/methionine/tyrosine aminotransferase